MSALPRPFPPTTLAFRLRMPKLIRELEDTLQAASQHWEEVDRDQANQAAIALEGAAKTQGLRQLVVMARSMASLMNIPRGQILPIRNQYLDKVRELLAMIRVAADRLLLETG